MANSRSKHLKKEKSKASKIFTIIKNVIFGVIIAAIICIVAVTLTARINGKTPVLFGYSVYRVSSGSMVPFLRVGDIFLSGECDPMELSDGDIITYDGKSGELAGKRVTHRVVTPPYLNPDDGKYYLVTKGDDNPVEDSPIEVSQVTGKYVMKLEWLKALFDFFVTPWGLLVLVGLVVAAFFNEIIIFTKALMGHDDNDDEPEDIQEVIERVQRENSGKQPRD